jgi:hypothetical protein
VGRHLIAKVIIIRSYIAHLNLLKSLGCAIRE